jgi:hypothetical protein
VDDRHTSIINAATGLRCKISSPLGLINHQIFSDVQGGGPETLQNIDDRRVQIATLQDQIESQQRQQEGRGEGRGEDRGEQRQQGRGGAAAAAVNNAQGLRRSSRRRGGQEEDE